MSQNGVISCYNYDTINRPQYFIYPLEDKPYDYTDNRNKKLFIFSGSFYDKKNQKNISSFGSTKGLAPVMKAESKAISGIKADVKAVGKLGRVLDKTRGAAYMNDFGEGLKPAIGQALAKRCWYPSLLYVGTSVFDKTFHDKYGNPTISVKEGSKELVFQTIASLGGPILLVNLGQNTIGKFLSKIGTSIGLARQNINPFKAMTMKSVAAESKNIVMETGKGIIDAVKGLPKDISSTLSLAYKDIAHPTRTLKKTGKMLSSLCKSISKLPSCSKNIYNKFKADKTGFIFGKNGILFGQNGLFGENGLIFGQKSGKVIGGLLAILLLYKMVDKVAAKIVGREEE